MVTTWRESSKAHCFGSGGTIKDDCCLFTVPGDCVYNAMTCLHEQGAWKYGNTCNWQAGRISYQCIWTECYDWTNIFFWSWLL